MVGRIAMDGGRAEREGRTDLAWQAANGFPSIEFYRAAQALKNVHTSPSAAIFAQEMRSWPRGKQPLADGKAH